MALEAWRLATRYMTPVIMLSDGYVANGSEPWRIPAVKELPPIPVEHPQEHATTARSSTLTPATSGWPAPGRSPARPA